MLPTVSAPLRILMVTPRYFPDMGGVETHVSEVTSAASVGWRRRHHPDGRSHWSAANQRTNRRRQHPESARLARTTRLLLRARNRPRHHRWLVGCSALPELPYPRRAARDARGQARQHPYLVTFHGGGHSSRLRNMLRGGQWALLRPLLARAVRLIAIARFEISLYSSRLRLPPDRFVFIPNGADLAPAPQVDPAPVDGTLIVSVGRLERYKGHHHAIAALPEVLKQRPDARLRIVGAGPVRAGSVAPGATFRPVRARPDRPDPADGQARYGGAAQQRGDRRPAQRL